MPGIDRIATSNIGRRRASAESDGGPAYQARREEIIAAAGQLFLDNGFRETSFKDIAGAIGLDRATLYYYFASKQELFQTATSAAVTRNAEAAERIAAADTTPADKVGQIFAQLLGSYTKTDYPYMFIFLQEDVNRITNRTETEWARTVLSLARRYEDALNHIFREGVESGAFASDIPPGMLTKALLGMTNWTHRWYRPDGALTADQIADVFTRILVGGATTRPS